MTQWPLRIAVLLVAFFLSFGLLIQGALPASACSCMMPNPVSGLATAEGAFVGTLVDVEELSGVFSGGELIDYTFEVEAALKGDIGEAIVVKSAADGAACGLEIPVGSRAGLTLYRNGDNWEGSLCATYDADALLSAAEGLPEPVAGTLPHLIVSADLGETGLIALDRQGNTVAYGEGPYPLQLSACPDQETFIGHAAGTVKAWSYKTLAVVNEFDVAPNIGSIDSLSCAGPTGDPSLAVLYGPDMDRRRLVRIDDGAIEEMSLRVEKVFDTEVGSVAIASDGSIHSVDAVTGTMTRLSEPLGDIRAQIISAAPSPTSSHVFISAVDWSSTLPEGRVFVVDLADGSSAALEFDCDIYPVWLDDGNLHIQDHCSGPIVDTIYTSELEMIGPGTPLEYGYNYVRDETGSVFYPYGDYLLRVADAGEDTGTEFARLLAYPGPLLVVPESARAVWAGPGFTPPAIATAPPVTTLSQEPTGGELPSPVPVDTEGTPGWVIVVGLILSVGTLVFLLIPPNSKADVSSQTSTTD